MKKLLSMVLVLTLVMSMMLVSCGKDTAETPTETSTDAPVPVTAESLVKDALEKYYAHNTLEYAIVSKMVFSAGGAEIEVTVENKSISKNRNSDDLMIYFVSTTSVMGEKNVLEEFYTGGYIYSVKNGAGTKSSYDPNTGESLTSLAKNLSSEVYEGIEIINNEDGSQSVELSLSVEQLGEIYENMAQTFTTAMGLEEGYDVTISDSLAKITVSNGELSKLELSYNASATVGGVEISMTCNMVGNIISFDDSIVITPPEGYLDFPEA